ncbi:MAG: RNA polymerase sigma-70 factor [Bacteroidetes bacterium]|nr:RNA polymerase sigma-70 factor [Bacteroidota bacterium]
MEQIDLHTENKLSKITFEQLFRTYFSQLVYFAVGFVSDTDTAKEIVHDVFINLWEKRENIDLSRAVKSYLYTSVHNRSLNYIRDNKKFDHNIIELERVGDGLNWEDSDKLVESEMEAKIQSAISSLPEKCREVFLLSRFENLKYNEIADKLGISVKTVETQISKALKVMREKLAEYLTIIIMLLNLLK